ncbi:uncharacterized protein LOC112003953 [Quercus suber]|uniref:uncharacterized protein LOC112003953 n=1 Tax=Quercus suber TaxID=58331 RepID=UPI000CE18A0C|nr:uncharacterized protein LOC112003953 [Quercus suber]XP_023891949.1 uncharacterized protein LOC112003955 [Quercus suber]
MAALKNVRQQDLFLSLKRDLALLTAEERGRKSAEAGLKNAQDQVEKQRKKLHFAEIELVTAKQQVLDLKVELKKAREAAWAAKEATKASKQKSYDLGDKGKGKEAKPLPETKDLEATLKAKDAAPKEKDVASKAKEADPKAKDVAIKAKEADPKATDLFIFQPGIKENPSPAKA